nr:hypothetical protein [Candidatus Gracilibacteria bacterium]
RFIENLKDEAEARQKIADIIKEQESGADYDKFTELEKEKQKQIDEVNKLLNEQKFIRSQLTDEQLKEAQRVEALSPAEKILEEYNAEKLKLENKKILADQELKDLEEKKLNETAILKAFEDNKLNLDKQYLEEKNAIEKEITRALKTEIDIRGKYLEELKQKALDTAAAMRSVSGASSSTGSTINNSQNTNIGSLNIQNGVDAESVNRIISNQL